ncbi:SMI1/KNR4 family protein [Pseudomonas sp. SZ57]|uniref:SMI1/KNR4 family protein n=1 Tax=Pseudomonas sp. SZ57 TaxID=2662259 RepID=UPI001290E9D7|nr:SMI1/KNR4 family protein [Pseudomonas sp. SZ57]MQQ36398.1 SMI1/KNR4 family protein [Pseudomonas sp. SZ57]
MNFHEFEEFVNEKKLANPVWFGLDPDSLASEESIEFAQKELNATLPHEYAQFVKRYGGGYFAFGIVYSLDKDSSFNILEINKAESKKREDHILFSENGVGDYYGFKIKENQCLPDVYFFDHETESWQKTKYENMLTYLSEIALSN